MTRKFALLFTASLASSFVYAQRTNWDSLGKESAKTEVYSPVPPKVTPGATPADAPSDAIVLFNGKNLDAWYGNDSTKAPGWTIADGIMTVNKKSGGIMTKQRFMDYQMHIEWRIPSNITGKSQARGNSGIFLAYLGIENTYFEVGYEVQVLDNFTNETYVNGQAGSIYKQSIPLANACKKPGEWQTYDIVWHAPRFNADGSLQKAATVTVIHNGVLVQDHYELKGDTPWIGAPEYKAHGASPIRLQSHGDPSEPVSFRNIWIRTL
ncbi:DUF1080 domain-containing protein [Pollutibacter soli]|uniref:3-keto-disaccharide hydrolase n=1 Tax=Pollutibacter soli TaxID=3034157 RepID=UPI0030140182